MRGDDGVVDSLSNQRGRGNGRGSFRVYPVVLIITFFGGDFPTLQKRENTEGEGAKWFEVSLILGFRPHGKV